MRKIVKKIDGIHLDRRTFLKGAALGLAGIALPLNKADASFWESFFQKHFKEMNDAEIKQVLSRLEREYEEKYKKAIKVGNAEADAGSSLRLRSRSFPLHRLQKMRICLR